MPFRLITAFFTHDCDELERLSHNALEHHRVSDREFFEVDVYEAIGCILSVFLPQMTDELEFDPEESSRLGPYITRDVRSKSDIHPREIPRIILSLDSEDWSLLKRAYDAKADLRIKKGSEASNV